MNEEKSNIEKLGEDLKGIAQDVVNSEMAKAAKEKLTEVANSEMAQKAKTAVSDAANSEVAKFAKEKLSEAANSEYAKVAREKLDAAAKSELAQKAKGKFNEEFSNAKHWVATNWKSGGYGKFRVIAASVIILLAIRGFLAGWGSSDAVEIARIQQETAETEAGAALLGAMLGGGGNSSSGDQKKTWMCRNCGNQVQSKYKPGGIKCQRPSVSGPMCMWQEMR